MRHLYDNFKYEGVRWRTIVSQVSLAAQLGELRGQIEGLKGRIDDMHRLLMLLIILVLQLLK